MKSPEAGTNMAAMITPTRLHLEQLNVAHADDFVAALAGIYEHSPWVAGTVAGERPFASLASLNDAMAAAGPAAPSAPTPALVARPPDLPRKAAPAANVTAESKSEQGGAGLDRLSDAEYALFAQLSHAYWQKFHIPFILCVRRHTKESILRQYQRRLQNTRQAELETALNEIFRIAALR